MGPPRSQSTRPSTKLGGRWSFRWTIDASHPLGGESLATAATGVQLHQANELPQIALGPAGVEAVCAGPLVDLPLRHVSAIAGHNVSIVPVAVVVQHHHQV